jgi:hypothetical protein
MMWGRSPTRPRPARIPAKTNMAIFSGLLALTFLLWVGLMFTLRQPVSTHDIGSGLLAAFLTFLVWGLLAALLVMSGMPRWAVWLAWILHPASFAAAIAVLDKGTSSSQDSWLIVVPVLAPLAIAAYASWAYFPAFHAGVPSPAAGLAAWGLIFVLAVLPWAVMIERSRESDRQSLTALAQSEAFEGAEARPESLQKLQRLTPESPLWEWINYTNPRMGVREEAFAGIRNLTHRQADADVMLSNGVTGFLKDLPYLGLEPTPAIVAAHKKQLRDMVSGIERPDAGSVKYSWISWEIDPYLPSIQWMAERHCGCSGEVAALEAAIRAYKNSPGRAECIAALDKAQEAEKK